MRRSLKRRYKLVLPDGRCLTAETDAEACAGVLISRMETLTRAADAWLLQPQSEILRGAYQSAYTALLEAVLGKTHADALCAAFSGNFDALCAQTSLWLHGQIRPLILAASRRRARDMRRAYRLARHRQ